MHDIRIHSTRFRILRAALGATALLLAVSCGSDDGGPSGSPDLRTPLVELGLVHHPKPLPEGGFPDLGGAGEARVFTNDGGQTVTLTTAELSVQSFVLEPCPESAQRVTRDHGGSENAVELIFEATDDILRTADLIATTKTYEVPDQLYCDVFMVVGPATLLGDERPAFRFAGSCAEGDVVRDFDLESNGVIDKQFTILNKTTGEMLPTPLDPTGEDFARAEDDDLVQDVVFGTAYPALFDGIDCVGASDAELLAHVSARVASNTPVHQHLGALTAFESF